jgi:metal-dependent hydrolase (beta-lactamase superfamily II)
VFITHIHPDHTGGLMNGNTRRRLLEDAARKGYIVAPDHLPFPGLGRIRKGGQAYTWVPVDNVNDAVEK